MEDTRQYVKVVASHYRTRIEYEKSRIVAAISSEDFVTAADASNCANGYKRALEAVMEMAEELGADCVD